MEVELYVYDLSGGMARQLSMALTGVQIDAIYHTSIVLQGVEYFFGQGIHRKIPGTTHHGQPMKVVKLGQTYLPEDTIHEYIQSLEAIYSPESYDLFVHNCNNFSQDLAMFLVGKSIPEEIRNLPETFLRTPMGQMLRGQIDQSMRQMTQAPDAMSGQNAARSNGSRSASTSKAPLPSADGKINGSTLLTKAMPAAFINGQDEHFIPGRVHYPTSTSELDKLLKNAESSCACIFFTSATCPPCKIVYPDYDQLAEEFSPKATLIKVDVSKTYDIAARYQVRATPTFITYLKGKKDDEWSGADGARLRGSIRLLVSTAHPTHAHARLRLPNLQSKIQKPIMYSRTPPLEKLLVKIGPAAQDLAVQQLTEYIRTRESKGSENAAIPDLHALGNWVSSSFTQLPSDLQFAAVDLVRVAAVDTRISAFLTTENDNKTLTTMIPSNKDYNSAPYNLQAVTLQLVCNLFSSNVFQEHIIDPQSPLRRMVERLASQCLLATHHNARSLAAALVYNLAAIDHNQRIDGRLDRLGISNMADLEAALVEAVMNESENKETLHSLLMALGLLLYAARADSSVWDLCMAMDVRTALKIKGREPLFKGEELIREVGEELLGKGGPGQVASGVLRLS